MDVDVDAERSKDSTRAAGRAHGFVHECVWGIYSLFFGRCAWALAARARQARDSWKSPRRR